MRQPWFASTMTSRSGSDSRTAWITGRSTRQSLECRRSLTARTPAVAERGTAADALVCVDELAARRVREDATAVPAEQPPHRLVPSAPEEIPRCDLDDPVAPVVEVDRLDDAVHGVGVRHVAADEQPVEERTIGHVVAARVALDPVVGLRTITTVASWNVRGSGSHAATNGGSSG